MTPRSIYSKNSILQAIRNRKVRNYLVFAIFLGATSLLVGLLLPVYRGLIYLFWLTILCNTFIPVAPQEPVILLYGRFYPGWLVAICAGVAISLIELFNYQVLLRILDLERIRGYRERRFYQRAEHYFRKLPFLSLVVACLTPIPFIPFRMLAVTTGYSIRRYILSVFVGRVPRFYLLALMGKALNMPVWGYIIILAIASTVVLVKRLAKLRKEAIREKGVIRMRSIHHRSQHIGKALWRLLFRNFIFRHQPFFAHMVVTKRCNLRCIYCTAWQQPPDPNELSTTEWFEVIDILDKLGVYVLSFTGGEPLLKSGIFDMIRYARSKGFYTRLTSNGTLPKHYYEDLIHSGINSISISLDSVEPEIQETLSQVKGSWKKTVGTLKFLLANAGTHQRVTVSTMVTRYNIQEIIPVVDFCSNVLRCPVFLQPVIAAETCDETFTFRPVDNEILKIKAKDVKELYQELRKRLFRSKLLTSYGFLRISHKYLQTGEYKWKCKAGQLFFDIMPDGSFYPCQDMPSPQEKQVLEGDFIPWFGSKSYKKAAKQVRADCSGCCYSCYIYSQHFFSWRLPDILGMAVMNTLGR